jgi:protein-disulfide isomerase
LRIVYKFNPLSFHQRAMPAAIAAACAGEQGKFWPIEEKIFENQRALEDADLEKYAKDVGVDFSKWKKCVTDGAPKEMINKDIADAMRLGARGTPAFYINGRFLSGAQPFPAFDQIVSEELKKAQSSGVPRDQYYQKAVVEKGEKKV